MRKDGQRCRLNILLQIVGLVANCCSHIIVSFVDHVVTSQCLVSVYYMLVWWSCQETGLWGRQSLLSLLVWVLTSSPPPKSLLTWHPHLMWPHLTSSLRALQTRQSESAGLKLNFPYTETDLWPGGRDLPKMIAFFWQFHIFSYIISQGSLFIRNCRCIIIP